MVMANRTREKPTAEEELQQVAVRLPHPTVERLDRYAEKMSQPGLSVSRSEALRVALHRGLDALEADVAKQKAKKRARRNAPGGGLLDAPGGLQTAVRLSHATVERIDALAERMSHPDSGFVVARSEALRVALHRGLDEAEREYR